MNMLQDKGRSPLCCIRSQNQVNCSGNERLYEATEPGDEARELPQLKAQCSGNHIFNPNPLRLSVRPRGTVVIQDNRPSLVSINQLPGTLRYTSRNKDDSRTHKLICRHRSLSVVENTWKYIKGKSSNGSVGKSI